MLRKFLGYLMIPATVMMVYYLQMRFDQSDIRNAVNLVRHVQPQGFVNRSIEERLQETYQVSSDEIEWPAEIESKFKGLVRVQAILPGLETPEYSWRVDVVGANVIPISEAAKKLGESPNSNP